MNTPSNGHPYVKKVTFEPANAGSLDDVPVYFVIPTAERLLERAGGSTLLAMNEAYRYVREAREAGNDEPRLFWKLVCDELHRRRRRV